MDILYEVTAVDLVPEKPQIFGCDGLQHIHAAASIAETVMSLQ